ncbi:hypothetical protein MKZ38_007377 [Zalerion maritima]|uniref:Methyltransferase n=1 Tax=Zalerion maritima TaxID=339359 RepID=A0AAD5RHT1_9PEZI|nr:hypothetical protein MKZ38_007377 [Zalerion maritima]
MSTTTQTMPTPCHDARTRLQYFDPNTKLSRRYLAPGAAINTGKFHWQDMTIRDGRPVRSAFALETTGFCLVDHPSRVTDWDSKDQQGTVYSREMEELILAMTGADRAFVFEPTLRRASTTTAWQPFGSEVHVDYTTCTAENLIQSFLDGAGVQRSDFSRIQCINVWRALSPGPQDHPLGVCDASTVGPGECHANPRIHVDVLPDLDNLSPNDEPGPDTPAADMFEYRQHHRWWFFSDMTADEALVFKLYDSDDGARAPRCPHTAFHDATRAGARPRESIEIRTVVCFK